MATRARKAAVGAGAVCLMISLAPLVGPSAGAAADLGTPALSAAGAAARKPTAGVRVRTSINRIPTDPISLGSSSVIADLIRVRTGKDFRARKLIIERRGLGQRRWVPSDRGRTDAAGWFIAQLQPGGIGTWQFRATALPTETARRKRRMMRTITVTGPTGTGSGVLWAEIATGRRHTCAVDQRGLAYCWGDGGWGALGNGGLARVDRPLPVTTTSALLGRRLRSLSAGAYHTCALDLDGAAYCWGDGNDGQLGDGETGVRRTAVPVLLPRGTRFARLSAGRSHTCAVSTDATAYCWGAGGSGQLGSGDDAAREPVRPDLSDRISVVDIAAGGSHTCAVTAGGTVWCWGAGSSGQLGDGSFTSSRRPVAVMSDERFVSVAAGSDFTCATTSTGKVLCWGAGGNGQLGGGRSADRAEPVEVPLAPAMKGLTAAGRTACARDDTFGALWCWGANASGQTGDGSYTEAAAARPVGLLPAGVVSSASGGTHSCAVTGDGAAHCWGAGTYGQLGDDTVLTRPTPARVMDPIR